MTELLREDTSINPVIKDRIEKVQQGIVPEGYKQTSVGIIPRNWEIKTIDDIRDQDDSHSFTGGPFGSNLKVSDYTDNGVRVLQLQNIGDGRFLNEHKVFTSIEKADELKSCNIYPGDILIAKMADPLARCCIVPKYEKRYLMASDGIRLKPDKKYNRKLIMEIINGKRFRRIAEARGTGTTRKRISLGDLRTIPMALPLESEQQKISDILSIWNQAIELKENLIKEKEKQKKGLMKRLFEQINKYSYVNELIQESKERELNPSVDKLLTVRLHLEGVFKRSLRGNETVGATTLYRRKAGQFIYGKQNFHNGALGIVPEELDGYLSSSDIPSFDFNLDKVNPKYFYYYWSRKDNYKRLEAFTTGTGSKRLNPKDFLNMKMKLPSLEKQNSISIALTSLDKQINLLKQELDLLKEQKKGLMQLLLTGIVRVGGVEKLE